MKIKIKIYQKNICKMIGTKFDLQSIQDFVSKGGDVNTSILSSDKVIFFQNEEISFQTCKTLSRLCVEKGEIESMKFLVENGASTSSLCMSCVMHDSINGIKFLYDKGVNMSEYDSTHASAIFFAVSQGKSNFVEFLTENCCDLSQCFGGIPFPIK